MQKLRYIYIKNMCKIRRKAERERERERERRFREYLNLIAIKEMQAYYQECFNYVYIYTHIRICIHKREKTRLLN